MITHFGLNYTNRGDSARPDAWVPAKNVPNLMAFFLQKIHDHSVCRCFVLLQDGTEMCVYWYQQGTVGLWADLPPLLGCKIHSA